MIDTPEIASIPVLTRCASDSIAIVDESEGREEEKRETGRGREGPNEKGRRGRRRGSENRKGRDRQEEVGGMRKKKKERALDLDLDWEMRLEET